MKGARLNFNEGGGGESAMLGGVCRGSFQKVVDIGHATRTLVG